MFLATGTVAGLLACFIELPALADFFSPKSNSSAKSGNEKGTVGEPVPVPALSQIVVLPFLVSGQRCTLTVLDAAGKPLSNAGLQLNEELFVSDSVGIVTFKVPEGEALELSLLGEGRKKISKRKFRRVTDRVFAESDRLAESVTALMNLSDTAGGAPLLTYAPAVVCPGDPFVLLGQNFSERISEETVDIDGLNAPVLSASPLGILALAPVRLRIGPQREISVMVNNQASNSNELDVATPFFNHVKTESDDVSPEKGKLGMNGSNVPCLIRVVNPDTQSVSLWSPKQEPLGKTNVLLSPGGDQNYLDIDMRFVSRGKSEPKIELSLEQAMAPLATEKQPPPQLIAAACRAEIIRLERRRIAAEYRLESLRKLAASGASAKGLDADKNEAETKVLSLRLLRLRRALASRKAIYESFGHTDAQYRQVLDDAAGGAMLTLDQSVKPIQIVSDGGVGHASGSGAAAAYPDTNSGAAVRTKKLSHRMMEPVIRLLPPMSAEQLSKFNAMSGTNSSSSSSASSTSSINSSSSTSNEPQLRQNVAEPEPGVSESTRAGLGQPGDSQKNVANQEKKKAAENKEKAAVEKSKPIEKKGDPSGKKSTDKKKGAGYGDKAGSAAMSKGKKGTVEAPAAKGKSKWRRNTSHSVVSNSAPPKRKRRRR